MRPIYLDYAATTPIDPRVAKRMGEYLTHEGHFANPASLHTYGQAARAAVEQSREETAHLLHADPAEIIWTSGATEADNLAIKGVARLYQRKGKHIVTMKTEHKAVLDTCQHLEKEGYEVTYLTPEKNGLLDKEKFLAALRSDTILVSIMHVNNETGVIQDIAQLAEITSQKGILFHVDAAQSMGKLDLDVTHIPADLISLSAHKVYGPKGIGALYLRRKPRVRVEPLLHGGGHEQGMRSGTLPTHQIVGMAEAFRLAKLETQSDYLHITTLRDQFLAILQQAPCVKLNSQLTDCVPHIINFQCQGMLADAILAQVPEIAASTASACQGKGTEGSYVLRAMSLSEQEAKSSMRISIGKWTTIEDINQAAHSLLRVLTSRND